MSNLITPEMLNKIQEKIQKWKDKLIDSTNSNPLLDFRKNKNYVNISTPSSILFNNLTGEQPKPFPLNELRTSYENTELATLLNDLYSKAKSILQEKGVNSLFLALGTLTWHIRSKKPEERLVSPILLVPVQLQKKNRKPEYTLNAGNEEISLNSLLVKRLRDEGITLPEVELIPNLGYDKFLDQVRNTIASQTGWEVEDTAYLSLFDDKNAAMIQDLEYLQQNEDKIAANFVIQGLALEKALSYAPHSERIDEKELDKIEPSSIYQICDADSSQQVVIEAAKAGFSFVVQGPPGTGKSQTIANIIAELIGNHKKVLLVAEKQTALKAVFKKFKGNLEDVCLNLHDQGTTKTKELVTELSQTISRLQQREPQEQNKNFSFKRLQDCRQILNDHPSRLHQELVSLNNKSIFDLYGEILKFERDEVPSLSFHTPNIREWTEFRLLEAKDLLQQLGELESFFREKQTTVWSTSRISSWSSEIRRNLYENIDITQGIQLAQETVIHLQELLGIQIYQTLVDLDNIYPAVAYVVNRPLLPNSWFQGSALTNLRKLFSDLKIEIDNFNTNSSTLSIKYIPEFFTLDLSELRELKEIFRRYKGIFRFFRRDYRRARKRLRVFKQVNKRVDDKESIQDIEYAIKRQTILRELENPDHPARSAFDSLFNAGIPDLEAIERALNWLEGLQQYRQLSWKKIAPVISSSEGSQKLIRLLENLESCRNQITHGFQFLKEHFTQHLIIVPGLSLEKTPLNEVKKFINTAKAELDLFQQYLYCKKIVQQLEAIGAKEFLSKLRKSQITPNFWFSVLKKGIYEDWLGDIHSDNDELNNFRQNSHEQKIQEFSELDTEQYKIAIDNLRQKHADNWQDWSIKPEANAEIQLLQKESQKLAKHKKIRQFIKEASKLITTLKPFWLMSPLAVSQYIEPDAVHFDAVIFDEASQILTEDAIPSIMRATQVIVVGDSKQLPPSSSQFQSNNVDEEDEEEGVYENLLDECSTIAFMQKFTLKWHYRSKEESLIAFSNYHFYRNELVSFPNPVKDASRGVHFHHVPNGVYNRGASRKDNIPEAEEVAKLTLQHFQDNRHMSLGIITSNSDQAAAIRKQLNNLRVEHPDFEEFCQENTEKFFIKPLEQVQGDERDVIFLSFVYGRDSEGKLTQGFGPFNKKIQEIGRRRLNVAITRARYKLVLVASIQAGDLQADNNPEVKLIQNFFVYVASGGQKLQSGFDVSPNSDLALEEDIYLALTQRGYSVQRRVGCSAYRIDLAVRDNQRPEEFLLGIECDGRKYSRLPTARDRDRLRQQVLKKLGWHIYRIWSREWNRDRDSQLNRLIEHIENLRNQK